MTTVRVYDARRSAAVAVLALSVMDALLTQQIIAKGGFETNPASRWLLDRGWLVEAKIGLSLLILSGVLLSEPRAFTQRPLQLVLWAYAATVGWNIVMLSMALG